MKKTFYIPRGNWPLNFEVYSSFFKRLGYSESETEGDFLVLPGGADIGMRPLRDEYEKKVYSEYTVKGRPIIGICRGMQLVLSEGGASMIPHIPDDYFDVKHTTLSGNWRGQSTWHTTSLGFTTNSRHHQGFCSLPNDWRLLDSTSDGIVEAVTDGQVFGVQWHPEREEMWNTLAMDWFVSTLKNHLND